MENVWFTSDLHFGHEKILWLGNGRPFTSTEEMGEVMVERWNARVQRQDRVYFLGDFSFAGAAETAKIRQRLNGRIHVVVGNHDSPIRPIRDTFESYRDLDEIRVNGQKVILCHYPLEEWHNAHRGTWHLHGHQHGNGVDRPIPRLDIGVDCFDFAPVSFEEIEAKMVGREWEPVSHH